MDASDSAIPAAGRGGDTWWWLTDGTRIFRSADDWTTVLSGTTSAPGRVVSFAVTDGREATVLFRWYHSCPAGAPVYVCTHYVIATTTDVGQQWTLRP